MIARFGAGKIRVRKAEGIAWMTVKGPRSGIGRSQFEYEIPVADAEEMLRTLCDGPRVDMLRHTVPNAGMAWSVDVPLGLFGGVDVAEIELAHPSRAPAAILGGSRGDARSPLQEGNAASPSG